MFIIRVLNRMRNSFSTLPGPQARTAPAQRVMSLAIRMSIYSAIAAIFLWHSGSEKLLALIYLPLGCFWVLLSIEKGMQLNRELKNGNSPQ
jgi:hypothetical protein